MKRLLSTLLFCHLFLAGSFSYAACTIKNDYPGTLQSPDIVSEFQQNTAPYIYRFIALQCTGYSSLTWYSQREYDKYGWQPKLDLMLDDLEANPRGVGVTLKLDPYGSTAQPIAELSVDFGRKGSIILKDNTSLSSIPKGTYILTVIVTPNIKSNKYPKYPLTRDDKRLMVEIGGLPITYAIDFKADPTIPICDPKYKYHIDRTNIMFNSVSGDYFDNGRSLQQDINFRVEREYDPDCNAEIVSPLIKINGPSGPDVETPDITGTHIAELKNGTSLALYQLKDGAAESPMNYGSSHDLNKIGGVNGLQSSRKVRVKWAKTPGKSVKTGRWHATMKYELYFR